MYYTHTHISTVYTYRFKGLDHSNHRVIILIHCGYVISDRPVNDFGAIAHCFGLQAIRIYHIRVIMRSRNVAGTSLTIDFDRSYAGGTCDGAGHALGVALTQHTYKAYIKKKKNAFITIHEV